MMKKLVFTLVVSSVVVAGCKKGGDAGGGAVELPPEMAAFQPKDATAAFQGAFATRLTLRNSGTISMAGDPAALDIKGNVVTAWDGTKEHKLDLQIDAPCLVNFAQKEGAMTYGHNKQFVVDGGQGGKLLIAEGAAGYRKGKAAIVCRTGMDNVVTVDDKGACKKWTNFGFSKKWEGKPEDCAWSQEDGKDVLTIGKGDWNTKVVAVGDTLQSQQFTDELKYTEKTADYAAAKAKTDEAIKAKK